MKTRIPFFLVIILSLVFAGCSGGSDDGGGTSGGSGTSASCEQGAGVYKYPDGSRVDIKPNCEFIVSLPDGNYGHGKVNYINPGGSYSMDLIVDTGPNRGTCATVSGTPTSYNITNQHRCN